MDPAYKFAIKGKLKEFLSEDLQFGDITSQLIPSDATGKGKIIARMPGIICGLEEIYILYEMVGCEVSFIKQDGDIVKSGDIVAKVSGPLRAILLAERCALNLLMHLSGVATKTREFQSIIDAKKAVPQCKIAATRKTMPGLRVLEKHAVIMGGGDPHRWNLDDMVLLKDTHRTYFGKVGEMVTKCKELVSFSKKIEVEVESPEDALSAARSGADIVMLDNMSSADMKRTIKLLEKEGLRRSVIIESSGNVNLRTVAEHAESGVDIISTSAITLKASPIDFSLELEKQY